MRAWVKVGIAVLCALFGWLAIDHLWDAPYFSLQAARGDSTESIYAYLDRLAAFAAAERAAAPFGALVGGVAAELIGGEIVALASTTVLLALLVQATRTPESMALAAAGAFFEAALPAALLVTLVRATRRRVGLVAGLVYAVGRVLVWSWFHLEHRAYDAGEWRAPTFRFAAVLFAVIVVGVVARFVVAPRAIAKTPEKQGPYRDPPSAPQTPAARPIDEMIRALKDPRLLVLAAAAFVLGPIAAVMPTIGAEGVPFVQTTEEWEARSRLTMIVAALALFVCVAATDLTWRRRATIWLLVVFLGIGVELWMQSPGSQPGADLTSASLASALLPIGPGALVVASTTGTSVGVRCGLVGFASALGVWSTRGLFFASARNFPFTENAKTWTYVACALGVVLATVVTVLSARRKPTTE